jgi:hypothetical protein
MVVYVATHPSRQTATSRPEPNTAAQNDLATRPARPLRIVKIGSEGIAIKPDTGDPRTDMQTVAMCGLDVKLALMFAAAPDMLAALKAADPLLMKLCAVAMNEKVADYLPFALLDEVKGWLAHSATQKAIRKAESL